MPRRDVYERILDRARGVPATAADVTALPAIGPPIQRGDIVEVHDGAGRAQRGIVEYNGGQGWGDTVVTFLTPAFRAATRGRSEFPRTGRPQVYCFSQAVDFRSVRFVARPEWSASGRCLDEHGDVARWRAVDEEVGETGSIDRRWMHLEGSTRTEMQAMAAARSAPARWAAEQAAIGTRLRWIKNDQDPTRILLEARSVKLDHLMEIYGSLRQGR
jgi:hypothetical protein